ncbi:gamma-glutamylcyclotransferase family protein [Haloarcula nitratireducens]|uniref:Gamma-glutamylcyclotransferase n=1 Tax=Haloarcula nitratireducens TaxID=2487749 RepID=A0AAW4PFQ7_9EURY|nr:gamma-glutamylcyclotransferase family protein [Halomicroarcula nitratireducens]MBX0296463.1 gamma-glutamylcyclotransferase [Halomicroarcula nitratireducens]
MDVFVYGTLVQAETAAAVLGEFEYRGPATVAGLHRVDGQYPTLAPGGSTSGRLLRTSDRDALDRYEGVDSNLYVRCTLPIETDETDEAGDTVECYLGDPAPLDAPVEWPGDGTFEERVRRYCRDERVVVRRE